MQDDSFLGVILTPQYQGSFLRPEEEFFKLLFGVNITPPKIAQL